MRLALVTGGALSVLVAGCGGVEREPNLAKAIERTEATGSARLEMSVSDAQLSKELEVRCDGVADYARQRSRLKCELPKGEFEMIAIGDTTYARTRAAGFTTGERWEKWTFPNDENALHALSPERLLTMLRSASRETERIGEDDVRGVPAVRYRLTVDREEAELGDGPSETVPVDVWIDDDGLVRRIHLEDADAVATMDFFDFGVDVDVEAPPADQVAEIGEGWTGYGPSQGGDAAPCSEGEGTPITEQLALAALRRHGFTMRIDQCVGGSGVVAGLTNHDETGAVVTREGLVFCHVYKTPPADASSTVIRRGVDGGDAELLLANFTCTILADSPQAEKKIDPLEEAFDDLQRAIRP